MGRRARSETTTKIIVALLERRTWSQAELARRLEVTPRTIRKQMLDLREAGVPLEREDDHPHVYWSVPSTWFPGGQVLDAERIEELSRYLARHPKTADRERLLGELLRALPKDGAPAGNPAPLPVSAEILTIIEDAAAAHVSLDMSYFSLSRGDRARRHVSVHRVEYAAAIRMVATCHRDGQLKWFRADRIDRARLDPDEPCRAAAPEAVEAFVRGSFDGYHGDGDARSFEFTIRWPSGRWAVRNLPSEAALRHEPDRVHVTLETSGLDALARHLVGLGALARGITPELRERMVELARGSLGVNS